MTTTVNNRNLYAARTIHFDGSEDFNVQYTAYLERQNVTKDNTVRRAKPTDLFGNCTSHLVTYDSVVQSTGKKHVVIGTLIAPCSYWTATGAPSIPLEVPVNDLKFKLLRKIKSENVNLAQDLAEYRQTCKMVGDLSRDIFRVFRSLRSGRAFANTVNALANPRSSFDKKIANRWLEYQYGWKPLISDIHEGAQAVRRKLVQGTYFYRSVTAVNRKDQSSIQKFDGGIASSPLTIQEQIRAKARCRYMIRDSSLKELSQFGITNPLELTWELIPYSFVVDWLFPVGDFLSCLDALNGTSNLSWNYSYEYTCSSTLSNVYEGQYYFKRRRTYHSNSLTSIPLPKLTYRPSKSLTAVTNGLALLSQLRGRS